MSRIMSAIEGISDEHINEFAFVQIPKRKIPVWVKVCSMAASFVLVALMLASVVNRRSPLSPVTGSDSESEYTSSGNSYPHTESSENKNDSGESSGVEGVFPLVVFNDTTYRIADEYPAKNLPDGYVLVGEVTSNNRGDRYTNGYSSGCHVGDKIYQNPDNQKDVFVRTTLFSGEGYWYIRFVVKN